MLKTMYEELRFMKESNDNLVGEGSLYHRLRQQMNEDKMGNKKARLLK